MSSARGLRPHPVRAALRALPVAVLLVLVTLASAQAHKVSVFAYVDGPDIVIDAFYSKSNKVNNGAITLMDAVSGEEYLRAATDAKGALVVPVPQKAVEGRRDVRIRLVAGEGHQDEIVVRAEEFAHLQATPKPAKAAADAAPASAAAAPRPGGKAQAPAAGPAAAAARSALNETALDEAALARLVEQAVDRAVEARLAPVKRLLLESAQKGPGPTEIIGGIGYIVGLFGVAAFVASRRGRNSGK